VYKVKTAGKDQVIVTDAMKSLTVYTYSEEDEIAEFKVKARYPNG
jgi:hypothetical protein